MLKMCKQIANEARWSTLWVFKKAFELPAPVFDSLMQPCWLTVCPCSNVTNQAADVHSSATELSEQEHWLMCQQDCQLWHLPQLYF